MSIAFGCTVIAHLRDRLSCALGTSGCVDEHDMTPPCPSCGQSRTAALVHDNRARLTLEAKAVLEAAVAFEKARSNPLGRRECEIATGDLVTAVRAMHAARGAS